MIGTRARTLAIAAVLACAAAALAAHTLARAQEGHPQVQRQNAGAAAPIQTNDEMQPDTLPAMPAGMTLAMIVHGDSLFHSKGGCFACHGSEGEGRPAAGDAITVALSYAQPEWRDLDSLITAGIPDALTRSPISMPWRGARGDLTDAEIRDVAAYVWAISQTRGEPWPGGHPSHVQMVPVAASVGTTPARAGPAVPR